MGRSNRNIMVNKELYKPTQAVQKKLTTQEKQHGSSIYEEVKRQSSNML